MRSFGRCVCNLLQLVTFGLSATHTVQDLVRHGRALAVQALRIGHGAGEGSGRLPITGLPGPMGSMGSIPGCQVSDDEDFTRPAVSAQPVLTLVVPLEGIGRLTTALCLLRSQSDNSGAGDAGPGLAGMLRGRSDIAWSKRRRMGRSMTMDEPTTTWLVARRTRPPG